MVGMRRIGPVVRGHRLVLVLVVMILRHFIDEKCVIGISFIRAILLAG